MVGGRSGGGERKRERRNGRRAIRGSGIIERNGVEGKGETSI